MAWADQRALLDLTLAHGTGSRTLSDEAHCLPLDELSRGTNLDGPASFLQGRSVLLSSERQLPTVLAAIALDGIARRLFLCLPDIAAADLPAVIAEGEIDSVVSDGTGPQPQQGQGLARMASGSVIHRDGSGACGRTIETEWILFTSGTTGRPKMVSHTLASLTGPLDDGLQVAPRAVWSTFYDVRRYGGLQILLRALLGGGSMVLSSAQEPLGDFLVRAGNRGVTHISGTPSHWRRALMSPAARRMSPDYVRLSGEVADQAVLDQLKQSYPHAEVAHAFASTEAGVAFDVRDGLEGFPASYIGQAGAKAEMRVVDGTLRIRSQRTASRYLAGSRLVDKEGFVDTGDMIEQRGERCYFVGRREGVINVGGQKVYPEEVETVLNRHPGVQMSRVWARRSPITGAVVAADVVLREGVAGQSALRDSILQGCRDNLPAHKVPVSLRVVEALPVGAAGKLLRRDT